MERYNTLVFRKQSGNTQNSRTYEVVAYIYDHEVTISARLIPEIDFEKFYTTTITDYMCVAGDPIFKVVCYVLGDNYQQAVNNGLAKLVSRTNLGNRKITIKEEE